MSPEYGEVVYGSIEGRTFITRVALRRVETGSRSRCWGCGEGIMNNLKDKKMQVIANIYNDGQWQRVERYHPECYDAAGSPHGDAVTGQPIMTLEQKLAVKGLRNQQK